MYRKTLMSATIILAAVLWSGAVFAGQIAATLTGLQGDVSVQAPGAEWAKATEGMSLNQGAGIKTGADSQATLKWGGHAVRISALSVVKIDALEAEASGKSVSKLSMDKGKVMAKVAKLTTSDSMFQIRTPTAIAGVRGTEFECAMADNNTVTVSVIEGSVSLAVGEVETIISEGFESSVAAGGMPETPKEIPPEKLEQLKTTGETLKSVKTEEKTEKKEEKTEAKKEAAPAAAPAAPAASAAPAEAPAAPSVDTQEIMNTTQDQTVDTATIQNVISDTAQKAAETCEGAGGCISGTVSF